MRPLTLLLVAALLVGCDNDTGSEDQPIRGLRTHIVSPVAAVETRRFPSILQPGEITTLAFEVGGVLRPLSLTVGQRVAEGDVLARLETTALALQLDAAAAALRQAEVAAATAADALGRQTTLLNRGATTAVAVETAQAEADAAAAAADRARSEFFSAQDTLDRAELVAPMDGIVDSVEATSYATVSPGTPIATLYGLDRFEVSFSASFDVVRQLVLGSPARIRLADRPDVTLAATVTEIAGRADAVSSFPVTLTVTESSPLMRGGMPVEVAIDLPLAAQSGFLLPLSVLIRDRPTEAEANPSEGVTQAGVFVYDPETSTVRRRTVAMAGIVENSLLVTEGLAPGERVASAGVSFLRDGQQVRLLGEEPAE